MDHTPTAPLHVEFEGTVNTRDLGGWPIAAGGATRSGRAWRSDAFTHATPADLDTLERHGARMIIDLRTVAERAAEPGAPAADPRFEVHPVDLFAPVVAAFTRGEIHGDPFDLATHYRVSFELARDGYREVFTRMAEAFEERDGAVVFHCTAGKDRTGLIAALLLRAAGVPDEAIARDYASTHDRIAPLRARLLAEGVAKGYPAAAYARLLEARPETILGALAAADDELLALAEPAAAALR